MIQRSLTKDFLGLFSYVRQRTMSFIYPSFFLINFTLKKIDLGHIQSIISIRNYVATIDVKILHCKSLGFK